MFHLSQNATVQYTQYNHTISQKSSFQFTLQVTFRSSAIWKEYRGLSKINHKKGSKACDVTATSSSPLRNYTYLEVEAEDVLGQRPENELCEKADQHCIYILHILLQKLSFNGYFSPYSKSEDRIYLRLQLPEQVHRDLSHCRQDRHKPGLVWKLFNFCSNIWLYIC